MPDPGQADNAVEPEANVAEATNVAAPADNAAANASEAVAEEPAGPPPAWTVQPGGKIGFSVGNGSETVSGSFGKWTAAIVMDPDHPDSADIKVTIDMASASVMPVAPLPRVNAWEIVLTRVMPAALDQFNAKYCCPSNALAG